MLGLTMILSILLGALASFVLSVFGLIVVSAVFAVTLLLLPTEPPISPLELAVDLLAMQLSYLGSGWLQSIIQIRGPSDHG
jgi:hypothetical protein